MVSSLDALSKYNKIMTYTASSWQENLIKWQPALWKQDGSGDDGDGGGSDGGGGGGGGGSGSGDGSGGEGGDGGSVGSFDSGCFGGGDSGIISDSGSSWGGGDGGGLRRRVSIWCNQWLDTIWGEQTNHYNNLPMKIFDDKTHANQQ